MIPNLPLMCIVVNVSGLKLVSLLLTLGLKLLTHGRFWCAAKGMCEKTLIDELLGFYSVFYIAVTLVV